MAPVTFRMAPAVVTVHDWLLPSPTFAEMVLVVAVLLLEVMPAAPSMVSMLPPAMPMEPVAGVVRVRVLISKSAPRVVDKLPARGVVVENVTLLPTPGVAAPPEAIVALQLVPVVQLA